MMSSDDLILYITYINMCMLSIYILQKIYIYKVDIITKGGIASLIILCYGAIITSICSIAFAPIIGIVCIENAILLDEQIQQQKQQEQRQQEQRQKQQEEQNYIEHREKITVPPLFTRVLCDECNREITSLQWLYCIDCDYDFCDQCYAGIDECKHCNNKFTHAHWPLYSNTIITPAPELNPNSQPLSAFTDKPYQSQAQVEAEPETQSQSRAEAEPETQTQSRAEPETQTQKQEPETQEQEHTEPETKTQEQEPETQEQEHTEPETKTQEQEHTEPETKTKTQEQEHTESTTQTQSELEQQTNSVSVENGWNTISYFS